MTLESIIAFALAAFLVLAALFIWLWRDSDLDEKLHQQREADLGC